MCRQCEDIGRYPTPPTWDERTGSDRLYWLKREIGKLERDYASLQHSYLTAVQSDWKWDYPFIPTQTVSVTRMGIEIPSQPGVYFVWRGEGLAYVGESKCLRNRCRIGVHEHIEDGDRLSWLLVPEKDLLVTEAFYIGIGRPWANFGTKRRKR